MLGVDFTGVVGESAVHSLLRTERLLQAKIVRKKLVSATAPHS